MNVAYTPSGLCGCCVKLGIELDLDTDLFAINVADRHVKLCSEHLRDLMRMAVAALETREPSQASTTFQVGDMVDVVDPEASRRGQTGRVFAIHRGRPCVRFDNGDGVGYDDADLRLLGRCDCYRCRPAQFHDPLRLCPQCHCKRCPKVDHHRYRCTGSNAPDPSGGADSKATL